MPLSPASWHTPPCSPSPFGTSAGAGSAGAQAAVPCRGDMRPRGGEAGLSRGGAATGQAWPRSEASDEGRPGGAHPATLEQPRLRFGETSSRPGAEDLVAGTLSVLFLCPQEMKLTEERLRRCAGETGLPPGLAGGARARLTQEQGRPGRESTWNGRKGATPWKPRGGGAGRGSATHPQGRFDSLGWSQSP